jgi:hypothetical protein
MDRRNFLRSMIGGVVAGTAVRTWPFRVFSFPSEIEIAPTIEIARLTRGSFAQLLAPGLRNLFVNYFDLPQRVKPIFEFELHP